MEPEFKLLCRLIEWDKAVVYASSGRFNASVVSSYLGISRHEAQKMVDGLKEYLKPYLDDGDFCSDIMVKWAHSKGGSTHTYHQNRYHGTGYHA